MAAVAGVGVGLTLGAGGRDAGDVGSEVWSTLEVGGTTALPASVVAPGPMMRITMPRIRNPLTSTVNIYVSFVMSNQPGIFAHGALILGEAPLARSTKLSFLAVQVALNVISGQLIPSRLSSS